MSKAKSGATPDLKLIVKALDRIGRKGYTHGRIAGLLTGFHFRQKDVAKQARQFFRYTWNAHFDQAIIAFCKLVDPTTHALSLKYLLKEVEAKGQDAQLRARARADLNSVNRMRKSDYQLIYRERNQRLSHEDSMLYVDRALLDASEIDNLRETTALSFTPGCVCDALEECRKLLEPYYVAFNGPALSWLPLGWDDFLKIEQIIQRARRPEKFM